MTAVLSVAVWVLLAVAVVALLVSLFCLIAWALDVLRDAWLARRRRRAWHRRQW